MSNLPVLAAAIVQAIRNSRGDSNHNLATVVQGMIAEAIEPELSQLKYMREWGSRCQDEMQKQAAAAMELRDLIHHIYIHDNYLDCGFMQMATPQKKLFVSVLEERGMTEAAERLKRGISED